MKTGISVNFAFDPAAARKAFSHLRELGYDCADLQTFVNTETEWFSAPAPERLRRDIPSPYRARPMPCAT